MMPFSVITESLDDGLEVSECPSMDAAVAYAKAWFLRGYDHLDDVAKRLAREEAEHIEPQLRAGETFTCRMFYEKISVKEAA